MGISSEAFIYGRVGELDIIRAGWRYMQRTMNDEDRRGFEQMINMPGFCVKKFEETYLLTKINPFAQTEEDRIIAFNQSDCPCGISQDVRHIDAIKQQLGGFLEKWEHFFDGLAVDPSSFSSTKALHEVDNLLQKTAESLETIEKQDLVDEHAVNRHVTKPPKKSTETKPKTKETKKQTKKENAVAQQCLWNVSHVSGKPVHIKNEKETPSTSEDDKSEKAKTIENTKPEISEKEKEVETATTSAPEIPTQSENKKPISIACTEDTSSLPSPNHDISPAITDNGRSAGTPDSGMISDISEVKSISAEKIEKELIKQMNPEKLVGRDGRRYRQKLREAEKLTAIGQLRVEEQNEDAEGETKGRESTESECTGSETAVLTGKEKRRLKDKMRKEKKEQEKLLSLNKVEENSAQSITSTDETVSKDGETVIDNTEPTMKDAAQENIANLKEVIIENYPTESTKEITKNEVVIEQTQPDEKSIPATENITQKETSADSKETVAEHQQPAENASAEMLKETEEENQTAKLSKSQKRRARNKANKGVYVVNDNGSHSVELLPGEYKILQLDQQRKVEEVNLNGEPIREVNLDQKISESKNEPRGKKRKSYYVAGNLSKEILDNGKWLAYVIDEKNPNGVPRFGEVSTEEVAETIKLLDSKMFQNQQNQQQQLEQQQQVLEDSYVDDYDYSSSSNTSYVPTSIKHILPELDPEYIRKSFEELETRLDGAGESLCEPDLTPLMEPLVDDLQLFLNSDGNNEITFRTEFARKTAPLLVRNDEFRQFCKKYANSKYDSNVISSLIKKYVDTRIVFHYERFKKLADRESHRISKCWTQVKDNSSYALMVMLFINNPTSNVGFNDVETVMFPHT